MAENEVDIVIRTRAELEGAKQLEKSLSQQIGQAKALGQNFGELTGKLRQTQAAISSAVPEFGNFSRILSTLSVGGPIGLLGVGIAYIASAARNAKESLLAFGEAADRVGREDATKGRKQLDEYVKSVDRIKVAAAEATARIEGLKSAFAANKNAEDQIADATKARELAEVDALVASGKLGKPEAAIRKAEIEGRHAEGAAVRQLESIDVQEKLEASKMHAADVALSAQRQAVERFAQEKGLTGAKDSGELSEIAEDEKAQLKAARAQLKEKQKHLEEIGVSPDDFDEQGREKPGPWWQPFRFKYPEEMMAGPEVQQVRDLEQSIPLLESKASGARQRATDAQQLEDMRQKLKDAEDAARGQRQAFGFEKQGFDAQRRAIRGSLPQRLRALQLTTGAEVIGAVEQQDAAEQAELARAVKFNQETGMSAVPNIGPQISQAGQVVAQAVMQMGASFQDAMASILRAVNTQHQTTKGITQQLSRDSVLKQ
jgi:hypothetical protein